MPIKDAQVATRHVIIGTAGHVDHGKTTLVRALTGTDPDRLAEEKARGMTIDLGFAFLDLPGDPPIAAGIVDVPGHERFVKNMLSGAGGIDIALVVVAADEGPMPQTREHLDILTILRVSGGVVALTKCDLVDDELREIAEITTREALQVTPLAHAPIVSVSAETGEGLPELIAALAATARAAPMRRIAGPFRLPVDRVFSLPGVGTIVTGTLASGTLTTGSAIELQPQGISTRARTLQTAGKRIESAEAGMRVAVNLPGVEVSQAERGAVLAPPGALAATTIADVLLSLLPDAPRPLRHRERVRVHLGTGETLARVHLLSGTTVEPGAENVPVQLLCETPIAPARLERFVLRSYSPARAIGGGIIVDPAPPRRYRRGSDANAASIRIASAVSQTDGGAEVADGASGDAPVVEAVYAALTVRHEDRTPEEIAKSLSAEPSAILEALTALIAADRAAALSDGNSFLSDVAVRRLEETARRAAGNFHRQYPLRKAMPRENLRAPLAKAATTRDFGVLLDFLVGRGILAFESSVGVRLPEHEVVIPANWRAPAADIAAVYASAGLTPPTPDNFQANYPRDVNVRSILQILAEDGQLVHIVDDLYLHSTAMATVRALLPRLAREPEGITVGTLRDATGSSRKIILPLLEYLDSQRVTVRVGDKRILASGNG